MAARLLTKGLAVLFACCAGQSFYGVSGITTDWSLRIALTAMLLVMATLLVAEAAWRLVWAAEDRDPIAPWLPALAVAAAGPVVAALADGRVALAVAIGSCALGVVAVVATGRVARPVPREAVRS
jgi:hypothetical protein